jgi:hypothetical protein
MAIRPRSLLPARTKAPAQPATTVAKPAAPRRPRMPRPAAAPRAARLGAAALQLLGWFAIAYVLTLLDLERRVIVPLLTGELMPPWALAGGLLSGVLLVAMALLARRIRLDAARFADQDPRASVRAVFVLALLTTVHAGILAAPLIAAPRGNLDALTGVLAEIVAYGPALPFVFGTIAGDGSLLAAPVVVALALVAAIGRARSKAWLAALPD